MRDEADDAVSENKAEQRSGSGENGAFHEELADDARTAGAEGGTGGEFLGARGGAGEEKIGEIDADDEKNESDGGPENDERRAEFSANVVAQTRNASGVVAIPIFVCGTHLRHEQIYFTLRALDGGTGL